MNKKRVFIIGVLLFTIPLILGAIYYNRLPEQLPVHFNSNDVPNNYASKPMALFGMPLIMLLIYVIAYALTQLDPRSKYQSEKLLSISLLIMPILTIIISIITIRFSLGHKVEVGRWVLLGIAIMFILVGNYLPKTKRNYTLGIKTPWTLSSDENWNKTHRLAGWLWTVGGFITLIACFTSYDFINYIFAPIIIIITVIPVIYSLALYKGWIK